MKCLFYSAFIFLILSCASNTPSIDDIEESEIWEVVSFNQNKREFIPEVYSKSYAVYNKTKNRVTIHYVLSDKQVAILQEKWKKKYKKIELKSLIILQELTYSTAELNIILDNISYGYILEGKSIDKVQQKIKNHLHNQKIGESPGLIGLLTESSHPIHQIPKPLLYSKIQYKLEPVTDGYLISLENLSIILNYKNKINIINR